MQAIVTRLFAQVCFANSRVAEERPGLAGERDQAAFEDVAAMARLEGKARVLLQLALGAGLDAASALAAEAQ